MGVFSSSIKRKQYYNLKAPINSKSILVGPNFTNSNERVFFQTDEIKITGLQKNGVGLSDKPMKRIQANLYTSLININTGLSQNTFTIDKGLAFLPGQRVYLDNNTDLIYPFYDFFQGENLQGSVYSLVTAERNDPIAPQSPTNPNLNYFPPRIATIVSYNPSTGVIVFDRNFLAQTTQLPFYDINGYGPYETPQNLTLRIRVIFKHGYPYGPYIIPPYNYFKYRHLLCINNQDILYFSSIDSEPTFNDNGIEKKIGFNYLILRPDTLNWELGRCKIQGETDPIWIKLASSDDKIKNEKHTLAAWFESGSAARTSDPSIYYGIANRRYFATDDDFYKKTFKVGDFIIISYDYLENGVTPSSLWGIHIISKLNEPTKTWASFLPPAYPQNRKALEIFRQQGDGSISMDGFVRTYNIEKLYNSLDLESIPNEESWILEQGVSGKINLNQEGPSGFIQGISSPGSGSILNTDKNIKIIDGPTGLGNFSGYPSSFTGFTGFTGGTGGGYVYEAETIYYSLITPITSEVERYKIDQFIKGLKSAGIWPYCAFCLLKQTQNKFNLNELLILGGAIGVSSGLILGGGYGASSWADQYQYPYRYQAYTQRYMWSNLQFYANTSINSIFTRPKSFWTTYYARTRFPPYNYGQPVIGGQGFLVSPDIDFYAAGINNDPDYGLSIGCKRNGQMYYSRENPPHIEYGTDSRPWRSYGFVVDDSEQKAYKQNNIFAYATYLNQLDSPTLPATATYFGNGAEMSSSIIFFANISLSNYHMYFLHDLYKKTAGALNSSIYNVETEAIIMNGL